MKYIKLFEKFTKEYQTKIDLKDFKKIKKGSMIQYMGGPVEVLDNNGYVLKLKGKDGKTFTVNKSQFDHGGRIAEEEGTLTEGELHGESVNESTKPYKKGQRVDYQLTHKGGVGKFADATSKSKNIESGVIKKRTKGLGGTFKYELTSGLELYGSEIVGLTEGTYNSKDHIGSTSDGQGANAEIYKKGKGYYVVVSGEVDYDFTAKNDKELLKKLEDAEFDSTDILESVNEKLTESVIGIKTPGSFKPKTLVDALDKAKVKYKINRLSMTLSVLNLDKKYFNDAKQVVDDLGLSIMMAKESVKVNEASRRKVHKAAKQGSYPAVIVVVQDGKVIHQEPVSTPDVAPATFNVMQEKYPKALLHLEDNTGKRLFSESKISLG
jgi:hypothetical protein